jgi:hypothetical protein
MTKKYVKATNGKVTIFRATTRPEGFAYGRITQDIRGDCIGVAFSNASGWPAIEISKAEYDALVAIKMRSDHAHDSSPQGAWVRNVDLITDAQIDAYIAQLAAADKAAGIE